MKLPKFTWENVPVILGVTGVLFDVLWAVCFLLSDALGLPVATMVDGHMKWTAEEFGFWGICTSIWEVFNSPALTSTGWAFSLVFDVYNTYTPVYVFFFYYLALTVPMFGTAYAFGCIINCVRTGFVQPSRSIQEFNWKFLGLQSVKCASILMLVLVVMIATDEGLRLILADKLAEQQAVLDRICQAMRELCPLH